MGWRCGVLSGVHCVFVNVRVAGWRGARDEAGEGDRRRAGHAWDDAAPSEFKRVCGGWGLHRWLSVPDGAGHA